MPCGSSVLFPEFFGRDAYPVFEETAEILRGGEAGETGYFRSRDAPRARGKCARAAGVGLPEREARTPKGPRIKVGALKSETVKSGHIRPLRVARPVDEPSLAYGEAEPDWGNK